MENKKGQCLGAGLVESNYLDQQQQLMTYVTHISTKYFNRAFQHEVRFNNRLRTTGGRYLVKSHNLEFNPRMANLPEFEGIVKHELVHYHLHLQNLGYQHRDADFKKLLSQVNGLRFAPNLNAKKIPNHIWQYQCEKKHTIFRQRRFQTDNYRCGKCGSKIHFIGEVSNT